MRRLIFGSPHVWALITNLTRYTEIISDRYVSHPYLTKDDEVCLRFFGRNGRNGFIFILKNGSFYLKKERGVRYRDRIIEGQ